ncbi:hypothetical protein [Clostridium sp. CF012]|uniref:hypothetical protein n=1 Tax=Clostridium sp. CF012 TaxID=2843319 RepID=UPI001C0E73A4|nr:hypothetical protein [Clostridium sp. CF012]MBU3146101.1 hypothetical protein [Clostridium sp. CF012]
MLSFSGCTSKNVIYTSAESVINEYIKTYYTISKEDIDLYRKIEEGITNKKIEAISVRFKPLLDNESYKEIIGTRVSYERIKDASRGKYSVAIKNIKLEKFTENKTKDFKTFDYIVELVQTSLVDNKAKNVIVKKGIVASKVNDGWRVCIYDIKSGADMENEQVETVIKNYVDLYYEINKYDIALYNKIVAGNKDSTILERDIFNASRELSGSMTHAAYKELLASKMAYGRIKEASEKKYYVDVKSIKLEKDSEDKANPTKVYYYDIVLTQTSIADNKVKMVKHKKQITLVKVEDFWKVEHAYIGEY